MRAQLFNVGDGVLFCGEQYTVEEVAPRRVARPDYFIRPLHGAGSMWVGEMELEPVELSYETD